MAEEKKPERAGPVVIRKGQLSPPAHRAPGPGPAAAPAEPPTSDDRPLWQRVAERAAPAGAPRAARPASAGMSGGRPGAPRFPERGFVGRPGGAGPRRDRPREDRPREAAPESPRLQGEPPPPPPEAPPPDEGSFADLLAGSDAAPRKRWQVGEKIAAKIIQIGHDVAFLGLG